MFICNRYQNGAVTKQGKRAAPTFNLICIFWFKTVVANSDLLQGFGNIFGSFFSCLPFTASLSRSLIQHAVGGKTQLASVVSCSILVLILLYIGPFFEPLPHVSISPEYLRLAYFKFFCHICIFHLLMTFLYYKKVLYIILRKPTHMLTASFFLQSLTVLQQSIFIFSWSYHTKNLIWIFFL